MIMKGIEVAGTPYVMLWMDDYLLCDYVNNYYKNKIDEFKKEVNDGNN